MKIKAITRQFKQMRCPLIAIGLFEGTRNLEGFAKEVDVHLDGMVTSMLLNKEFNGGLNKTSLIHSKGTVVRILLIGLGKREKFVPDVLRSVSGKVANLVKDLNLKSYAFIYDQGDSLDDIQAIVEGAELGLYRFDYYKSEKNDKINVNDMSIVINRNYLAKARRVINVSQAIVRGVNISRDISNLPSSDCTPSILALKVAKIARKYDLKYRVLERNAMKKLGFGGVLGVARGSHQAPKFIILEHNGGKKGEKPILLVGKTITFDSGGISIKPSERMDEMKHDKSGGATVIGIMQVVAELGINMNVIGLIPATENLPGGSAYMPGDVLTFYNGKTAEILNTDAEGRLILADALAYGQEYKPQAIIDFATLTGACIIALGNVASGLMGTGDTIKSKIVESSKRTGERVWELPLWAEYHNQIKSEIADIKNVGGRAGGTITAAAFLSNFVGDYPWAHLDIAGTAWTQESTPEKGYNQKGATGVGVRLTIDLLMNWNS